MRVPTGKSSDRGARRQKGVPIPAAASSQSYNEDEEEKAVEVRRASPGHVPPVDRRRRATPRDHDHDLVDSHPGSEPVTRRSKGATTFLNRAFAASVGPSLGDYGYDPDSDSSPEYDYDSDSASAAEHPRSVPRSTMASPPKNQPSASRVHISDMIGSDRIFGSRRRTLVEVVEPMMVLNSPSSEPHYVSRMLSALNAAGIRHQRPLNHVLFAMIVISVVSFLRLAALKDSSDGETGVNLVDGLGDVRNLVRDCIPPSVLEGASEDSLALGAMLEKYAWLHGTTNSEDPKGRAKAGMTRAEGFADLPEFLTTGCASVPAMLSKLRNVAAADQNCGVRSLDRKWTRVEQFCTAYGLISTASHRPKYGVLGIFYLGLQEFFKYGILFAAIIAPAYALYYLYNQCFGGEEPEGDVVFAIAHQIMVLLSAQCEKDPPYLSEVAVRNHVVKHFTKNDVNAMTLWKQAADLIEKDSRVSVEINRLDGYNVRCWRLKTGGHSHRASQNIEAAMADDPRFEFAESDVDLKQGWSVHPSGVTLTFYHPAEIRAMSVITVDNPTFMTEFGEPTPGGLHDRRMGPMSDTSSGGQYLEDCCLTCGLNFYYCPGHFGRLELPFPVINPICYEPVMKLLKICCVGCNRVRLSEETQAILHAECRALEAGFVAEPPDFEKMVEGNDDAPTGRVHVTSSLLERRKKVQNQYTKQAISGKCPFCSIVNPKFLIVSGRFMAEKAKRHGGSSKKATATGVKDFEGADEDESTVKSLDLLTRELFTPSVIRAFFRKVWATDGKSLSRLFPFLGYLDAKVWEHPTDALFVEVLPIPPPKVRPMNYMNGITSAHSTTEAFRNVLVAVQNVLRVTQTLKEKGKDACGPLEAAFFELQITVNRVYDRDFPGIRRMPGEKAASLVGLKQMLEKKEGLFRMYMMGKRVDFAARSVITPDPLIGVEEIGIPFNFATKLTFPTPVTSFNLDRLRQAVINGPETYPGAEMVEMEDGRKLLLRSCPLEERKALASELAVRSVSHKKGRGNKIVHRHMRNGDMVLVNRQPSLHRASIMAHKVRVLTATRNTLRLHYANCKAYNADFDGDEMNVHFPQSYAARSEAQCISNVGNQYLVPKDGTPLSGLIQDHVIAGVRLTIRGKFLTKEEYSQLVYAALGRAMRGKPIKTLPPAILKPKKLWTGKQVISTMLINLTPPDAPPLTMESKAKLKEELKGILVALLKRHDCVNKGGTILQKLTGAHEEHEKPEVFIFSHHMESQSFKTAGGGLPAMRGMGESEVGIYSGHLLHGVVDKNQLGATPLSVVHAYYELFGSDYSCALLTAFSALLTCFLSWEAFSLGVHDILVNDDANKMRKRTLKTASKIGYKAVADVLEFKEDLEDPEAMEKLIATFQAKYFSQERNLLLQRLDMTFKRCLDTFVNEVQSVCMGRGGLVKSFPENNLLFMIDTGAKGSRVNALQMSCLLGQMELEGRRPGLMISGRTLPSFVLFDPSPRAGGFIAGRYMTGIGPQELFFHCMAGREGLVDTAVKTSRSGYLQRSLVKHLESVHVSYDATVRDADETVIQFLYGEDGMEVGKTPYLGNMKSLEIFDVNPMVQKDMDRIEKLREVYTDVEGLEAKEASVRQYNEWAKIHAFPKPGKCNALRIAQSPFCHYYAERCAMVKNDKALKKMSADRRKKGAMAAWHKLGEFEKARYVDLACGGRTPDPVVADFPAGVHLGSVTERLDALIESYVRRQGMRSREAEGFRERLHLKSMASQVNPGEAVGIVAAQSIGEPSTQMTLNTFHFAGRGEVNVTLGIPRLREILMTASAKIKTPTMEVPSLLKDEAARDASLAKLKAHFNRVTLADVLEKFDITEELDLSSSTEKWVYKIKVCFLPERYFRDIKSKTIVDAIDYLGLKFFPRVLKDIWHKAGVKKSLLDTSKSKKVRDSVYDDDDAGVDAWNNDGGNDEETPGERHGASSKRLMGDDDDEADAWDEREGVKGNDGERDATEARLAARDDDEEGDFEPEQEDEDELAGAVGDEEEVIFNASMLNESALSNGSDGSGEKQIGVEEESSEEDPSSAGASKSLSWKRAKKILRSDFDKKRKRMLAYHPCVMDYSMDLDDLSWCEFEFSLEVNLKRVDVAEVCRAVAEKSVLHEVPGIAKAVVVTATDGEPWLRTEGINFTGLYAFGEELDLNRIRCNSIHDMAAIYGIEAAARTIVMELENVFKVYGIEVDRRHLTLVADYMTVNGSIRGYNRRGLEYSPCPLQKITFETATGFLKSAVMNAERDDLSSVSSSLVVGTNSRIGTGASSAIYSLALQKRLMGGLRWNFLEDHRYAKSPRAFPKPTAPRPAPQIDSDEEPSTSSFASQQLSSRRMFPVPDKPKDPLADKFNFTSLASTTPSFSGSVLLASPKKPVIPEGGTLDPSKLVYRDVDALDAPSERREKKSITGRSQKYNLGNSHDPGNYSSVSTSFFGKKKTKHVTSHQMEPRQLSLTGDILLNDIIGDPESRRMRPPEKLAKIPRKKKKKSLASASRLSSSSDDNDDVFVWDTVKPKSKGKEARERSKAEEIARKEGKKSRKIAKEPKPSVKTPKKAVLKKAGSKSDTKKAKSTPLASEKKKEPKKRMSILASVTALASSKKKNKSKKPTLLTSPDTTTETHKAALPPSSTIDEDDGAVAVAGPSGIQNRKRPSTVWLNEDGRDEKYFNRNFSSVSLENVIVSPRRRNSSQSAFGVPEEEPAAAVAVARPVPPKKPKRKI